MVTARVTAAATGGTHVFVLATSAVVTGPTVEPEAQFLPRRPDGTATVGVAPCCRLLLLWCQLWSTVTQHDSAQVWGVGLDCCLDFTFTFMFKMFCLLVSFPTQKLFPGWCK